MGLMLVLVCAFWACDMQNTNKPVEITGRWNARWELMDKGLQELFTSEESIMHGELYFNDDQSVDIRAYGFRGCAFTSDTSENRLSYHLNDTLLKMINDDREVVFTYVIREKRKDYMDLSLMDDIRLILVRQ